MVLKYINSLSLISKVLLLFIVTTLGINIFLLNYSPLPWFDEVFFASITNSFIQDGSFHLSMSPLMDSDEILTYGPVYFTLNSVIIKLFGWGLLQFRMLNFVSNVLVIFIALKLINSYIEKTEEKLFFISIYVVDTMFVINSHGGRMDGLALLFVMLFTYSLLILEKSKWRLPLSGLFFALAVLTTPRSVFFMLPLLIISLISILQKGITKKTLIQLIVWGSVPAIIYIVWVFTKFGSFESFLSYYLTPKSGQTQSAVASYMNFSPYIKPFEYPIFFTALGSFIFLLFKQKLKRIPLLIIISVFNIILFYTLILDTGMYSIFIIPFFYIIVFVSLNQLKISKKVKLFVYLVLFGFNLSLFTIKNTAIIADLNLRSHKKIDKIVEKHIPENSKVIGNELYFYSILKNKCDFQTFERGGRFSERINYHYNTYDFDYFVVSDQFRNSNIHFMRYYRTYDMDTVAKINCSNKNNSFTVKVAKFLDIPSPFYSYEGLILKRNKK